jgi:hypothetical protein
MKTGTKHGIGLALLATLTPQLLAQPAVPPAAVPATVVVTPAAQPMTLWDYLGLGKAQWEACKIKFCNCPLGQLLNNSLYGPGAFTGGILGPCCPIGPTLEDLNKDPTTAVGAAAQIQKREAEARARRLAVRYLGTVDCHWYPEAKVALIGALRGDQNECVRLEAAIALQRGCCCNKDTIKALTNTLSPAPKDGFPVENSERVKAAAFAALDRCLACQTAIIEAGGAGVEKPVPEKPREVVPPPEKPGEATSGKGNLKLLSYYEQGDNRTMAQVIEEARRVMDQNAAGTQTAGPSHVGGRSIVELVTSALSVSPGHATTERTVPQPAATPEPSTVRVTPQAAPNPVQVKPQAVPGSVQVTPQVVPNTVQVKPQVVPSTVQVKPQPVSALQPVGYNEVVTATQSAPRVAPLSAQPAPQAAPLSATGQDALAMLRNGTSAEHREWAANYLSTLDWRSHPELLQSLLTAARTDSAPGVRAQCIRCVVRMQANTLAVVNALRALKADSDAHVRQEAEQGLVLLASCQGGACSMGPLPR